jgi:hypothetical protein
MTHFQLSLPSNPNPILSSILSRATTLHWRKKSLISTLQVYQIVPKKFPQNENQKHDSKQITQRGTRTRGLTLPWRATTSPGSGRRDPPRSGGGGGSNGESARSGGGGGSNGEPARSGGDGGSNGERREREGDGGLTRGFQSERSWSSDGHVRACSVIPNTHGLDGIGKNCEDV